jgi:predicted transcriptional regulator
LRETGKTIEDYQYFGNIEKIQALLRSKLKIQLLLALLHGEKTLSQFREITGSSSPALIPRIRNLEASQYLTQTGYTYHLTPLGEVMAEKIQEIILYNSVISKFAGFWATHFIEPIPNELLLTLRDIDRSEVITNTHKDIFRVYHYFMKAVEDASWVGIISPLLSLEYTEAVAARAREGIPIEIIASKDLLKPLSDVSYRDRIRNVPDALDMRIYVLDPMPLLELMVTDKCFALGLFDPGGQNFDTTMELCSKDQRSVCWACRLFLFYRNQAIGLKV